MACAACWSANASTCPAGASPRAESAATSRRPAASAPGYGWIGAARKAAGLVARTIRHGAHVRPLALAKTFSMAFAAVFSVTLVPALMVTFLRGRITPEGLKKVTRDALVDFHRTRYVPDHSALAISGDISLAQARKLVEAKLGGWKKTGAAKPDTTEPQAPGAAKVSFVARPNSVQTNLIVGAPAISRTDPEYDVVSVMNKVIGGGPTGRLFMVLREEKGYTYGAYSNVSAPSWRGAWQASTQVRTEVTGDALRDLLAEVTKLREQAVSDKEFADHKRSMVGSFALSLESPQQMISYYITSWRYGLPADYWDKYPARIAAVTQAQVQAAARKYLDPAKLQIVAVGDPASESVLKTFGTIETYDADGKRIGGGSQ